MRVKAAQLIVQNTAECCKTYSKKFCTQPRALRLKGTNVWLIGKSKSNLQTSKAGSQKKRITGNSRVYPKIYPILLFHALSRALCLWFAFILTTCFDGLFSEFRIKVTGNSLFFSFAFLLISSFVAHFKYRLFCSELWLANFLAKEQI